MKQEISKKALFFLILVSALGYFVDVFDLLLFSVIRNKSLIGIGIPESQSLDVGLKLLNCQMLGLILGGILWGMIGDKKGRLTVLFGSILLYSIANIMNAFVNNLLEYQILRIIAGIGLAGELGAGITLVSETMKKEIRGYGGMIIASVGLLGAIVASLVGLNYSWQTCFLIGGILGLVLLILRIGVYESGLYKRLADQNVSRGNFLKLLSRWSLLKKYLLAIAVGLPTYFFVGLLVTGAPEFGKALGMTKLPIAGSAVMYCYVGLTVGDIVCTSISQMLKTRRVAFMLFNFLCILSLLLFLYLPASSTNGFYLRCFFLGFSVGYWALITINASEQFGTNLRATAATTVPNFVRAVTIPVSFFFGLTKVKLGAIDAAASIGLIIIAIALFATFFTRETFGKDLDFIE